MRRLVSWPGLAEPVAGQATSPSMPEHASPFPGRVQASAMAGEPGYDQEKSECLAMFRDLKSYTEDIPCANWR